MKKTGWFPASIKPVRSGYYEVRGSRLLGISMRYFDGTNWRAGWQNELISIFGHFANHEWRGFLRDEK